MKLLKGGKKIAGLPRNAWIVLLVGAVVVGLYLRSRRKAAAAGANQTSADSSQTDMTGDAGLAGIGSGSPGGSVVPIGTPNPLDPGLQGVIEAQGQTIANLAGGYNPPNAVENGAGTTPAPVVNITLPGSGGGPPKRPARSTPNSAEARRRYAAIAKRHGPASPAAKRAKKRLGIR